MRIILQNIGTMKGCSYIVYLGLVLGATALNASENLYELNVLHFNDFHAHFEEVSPTGTVCNPTEAACVGGFARLYTAVQQGMEAEPASLLLNGGDTFQGTIWYNFLRGNVSQYFMNLLPHHAHVLGNHEFDHGVEGLVPYLRGLHAPMLGANVNASLEPELAQYLQNHEVVTRNKRDIGIIGVLLTDFTGPIGRVILEDEVEAINREAAILTEKGVDVIIVLSHVGLNFDIAMARVISPEVDMIVGAHSHSLLYTGEPPSGTAVSEYPTLVHRDDGHRVLIVQASAYTQYLGSIKLFIDEKGIVQSWEGKPIYLGTSIIPDPAMVEELKPWRDEVNAIGKEVLGVSKVTLNRSWCNRRECNMGSWACDGFLEEVMDRAVGSAWQHAHICLINSGGLRVQIDAGTVTTESLLMAMPFENYVQLYELEGRYILEALEYSVAVAVNDPASFSSRDMLQIGGMRVVFNISKPIGSRVVSATVRCIDCDVPRYEPINPNATYRLVTQNFIGEGGDGFTMIAEHRKNVETLNDLDYVVLQKYMRRQQIIFSDLDGRIQVLS